MTYECRLESARGLRFCANSLATSTGGQVPWAFPRVFGLAHIPMNLCCLAVLAGIACPPRDRIEASSLPAELWTDASVCCRGRDWAEAMTGCPRRIRTSMTWFRATHATVTSSGKKLGRRFVDLAEGWPAILSSAGRDPAILERDSGVEPDS